MEKTSTDQLEQILDTNYPAVGPEKSSKCGKNCTKLVDPYGSVRYILDDGTKKIASIQIMVRGNYATVGTIYVKPEYRRRGIATELFNLAKSEYPTLQHSDTLTTDGEKFVAAMTESVMLEEKGVGEYSESSLISEITKIADAKNRPRPIGKLDTGADAMVFTTNNPDVVIRAERLNDDESMDDTKEYTYLANDDIQETGGVAKIYNIRECQVGEDRYMISWKEMVDQNFEYVIRRKYSKEQVSDILYALHLYDPFYDKKQFEILKNCEETSRLYAALMAGLPRGDLAPELNLGLNKEGYIVAYDC